MQALIECIDEIALDGLDGCPIPELWKHLEEKTPPFSLKLDDSAKQFLWKGIVQTKEVEFFVLDEPLPHLVNAKCDHSLDKEHFSPNNPLDQFQGPLKASNEFKLVSEQGIKGSCPSYFARKNVTGEVQGQAMYLNLEAVHQRWGDLLVIVASQELREKSLFGVDCSDPNAPVVDVQYCLMEHIGQARYNGRMQRTIASNYMKIDSKTIFHHLKKLRELHLITMQQVVITTSDPSKPPLKLGVRNFTTNIVRLKRFHKQQHHKYDVLAANFCQVLLDSPNQELPLVDILKHFSENRSTMKRVRKFLQQAGYVVEEKSETDNEAFSPPKAKKKKKKKKEPSSGTYIGKLRLVKPFVLKTENIWQPSVDQEEEEGHDDEEEEDGFNDADADKECNDIWDDDYYSNLVAERPMLNQIYDVIWQAGSRGCTLKKIQLMCRLPFYDTRIFVKKLKCNNLVQEVCEDCAKTRVIWFVATPFVDSNTQTVKVKQLQDQLKEIETRAVESQFSPAQRLPKEHPLQPLPSCAAFPAPPTGDLLDVKEKKTPKSKSVLAERVTYRKLKRKQMVLEYMQNTKVVEGAFPFQKAIMVGEQEEGLEGRIDRKGVIRILEDLICEGLMRQLKTVVYHDTVSQMVELYLHPSISNDDQAVASALGQCRARLRDESFKAAGRKENARQAERNEQRKLEKARAAEEKEKKKLEKLEKNVQKKTQQKHEKVSSYKYGFLPRFPRLQILHELMWKLVYGDETNQESQSGSVEGSYHENDECLKNLKPLRAQVFDEDGLQPLHGWFRFSDVLSVMPLVIICKTVDITDEIEGFNEYALDPVKKYTLVCDLPRPLRSRISEYRKVKSAPLDLLCRMSQMGLITPSLPFPICHRDIKLFLNKGVKLLDTSVSQPGCYTAQPPDGTTFAVRTHMFTSMTAVRSYWSDLKCVCLNTPLGVIRSQEVKDSEVPLAGRDVKLVSFAKEKVDENRVDFPPGDQLGAGGLDRRLFGHLPKNWTPLMGPLSLQAVGQQSDRSLSASSTISVAKTGDVTDSGSVLQEDEKKEFLSLGRAEMKRQAKKGTLKQQNKKSSRKRKAEDAQKTEGVKRRRTKKAKPSEKKKVDHSYVTAVDEEDRNILARKTHERTGFSAEEDSWLLLFHIALGIMKKETSGFHRFVCMRNILHKKCAASFDKTAPNIQRRILKLMKDQQSQMTVKVCALECAHDKSFQGFDDPNADFEETFKEVVKRLRQKFSTSSLSWDGDLTLVSSKRQLHDQYKVQTLVSKDACLSDGDIVSIGPVVKSVSDINKAALRDQIQIALTTPREIYDAYRVFQMFNSFTKEELSDVFKDMQKKNLVSRKKTIEDPASQLTRSLPFASMTYQLSPVYHRLFLQAFKLVTLHKDCAKFWTRLLKGGQLSHPGTASTASDILTPGSMELKANNTCGGDVACILSLLVTNKVSVEMNIPDEMLNIDASECETQTNVQQRASGPGDLSLDLPAEVSNKESGDISLHKRTTTDACQLTRQKGKCPDNGTKKSHVSPSTSSPQRKAAGRDLQSSSSETKSTESLNPLEKNGSSPSTTKEERPDKREVFSLNIPSSTVTTFASTCDLKSAKESCDYLKRCTEAFEVEPETSEVKKVTTVPVASLSYNNFTSKSSRTALMLARGGKDPYVSINQLPARAFNTHDFMTLYHIKNVLRLKADCNGKAHSELDEDRIANSEKRSKGTNLQRAVSLSHDIVDDNVTSPVIVTETISIEEYLHQMKTELVYNEVDASLAREIHSLVEEFREFGCPVVKLQGRVHESHGHDLKSSQYSFDEHVEFLCEAKQLYKVGFYEVCLVTASFVKPWCLTLLKPKSISTEAHGDKDVEVTFESSNSENIEAGNGASNQEGKSEGNTLENFSEKDNKGLEIVTGDVTSERMQSSNTQLITECSASPLLDVKTPDRDNDGTSKDRKDPATNLSFEPVCGLSSEQTETSDKGKKKSKNRNFERYSAICRPWITIDGTTSKQLLRMFREMVLILILDNPGIPEGQIAKHVFEAVRPAALHDILKSLVLDGCIVKHVRKLPPKMSLFAASKPEETTKTMTFYTPTVDCIFKIATSRRTGYT